MNHDGYSHPDPRFPGEKLPPQNIEAEQGTLGSILLEEQLLPEISAFLEPEDFYRQSHEVVYRAILELAEGSERVDSVTVSELLIRRGRYAEIGCEEGLRQIIDGTPNAANGVYYAQIVHQKAVARKLLTECNEVLRRVYSNNFTSDELCDEAEKRILAVNESRVRDDPASISRAAIDALVAMDRREQGVLPGLPTGFEDLDSMIDGLHPRKLYILAARPGIGKSALALNIADFAGYECGKSVLFVSLEMDRLELSERFLMSRAKVDGDLIKVPSRLGASGKARLQWVVDNISPKSKLTIDDPAHLTITQLAARARRHKHRHGLGLLVVDYLQLIDGQRAKGDNREQEIARISRRLKGLAKELHVPVLALCQLNRAVESREGRRPGLADLRESGQIEQDADCVILLHRPELYDPNDNPGEAFAIVAKNRGGRTGQATLKYIKSQTRFESVEFVPPAVNSPY
jgi:replicative DNA helicase